MGEGEEENQETRCGEEEVTPPRLFSNSLANRLTVAAAAIWLVYVVAVQPFAHDAQAKLHWPGTHWYEGPFLILVAFGQHVAAAVGLYPNDSGAVQVLSGLLALIVCVQAACWVKAGKFGKNG